ncbi:MAG: hypothetical protein KME06_09410 [Kastovskya adunca ATA6-11-RM4]|jgi:hypothetical protein|nr:hypothetical protein [Kastovskya adunca ATA6-11-RM4]
MSLKLSINGLSLTINRCSDPKFPRARIQPYGGLEYSIHGTPIGDGSSFEPKFIWTITAVLLPEEALVLEAIYAEFDRQRRMPPYASADILLVDTYQQYIERLPRTRAIAPGATESLIGSSHVGYFPQFKAWMVEPPVFSALGYYRSCTLTLQESVLVSA